MAADRGARWWTTVRVRITALATLAVALVLVAASVLLLARQRAASRRGPRRERRRRRRSCGRRTRGRRRGAEVRRRRTGRRRGRPGRRGDRRLRRRRRRRPGVWRGRVDGRRRCHPRDGDRRPVVPGGRGTVQAGAWSTSGPRWRTSTRASPSCGPRCCSSSRLATAVLAVLVWTVVGRTLRPVERIRAEVASIGLGDLDRRVPEPTGDDEIARLAVTMNEMLARLERAVRRQQQFVADASHELRTPLTRMRTELEVDERHGAAGRCGGDPAQPAGGDRRPAAVDRRPPRARPQRRRRGRPRRAGRPRRPRARGDPGDRRRPGGHRRARRLGGPGRR